METSPSTSELETSVTVTSCEKEPIHIPGSIQPFGIVLVMDLNFDVLQVSANAETELSTPLPEILKKNLSQLISKDQFFKIKTALMEGTESAENPFLLSFKFCPKWLWESFVHRLEDRIILEVEHFMIHDLDLNFRKQVNLAASLIEGTQTVINLCQTAAEEIQKISGYDRVMIYRFDESWNGKVIAEARREASVDSYMGHHFPASDIPPQARAVFLANWLRMIPDVNYRPAPLVPVKDPITRRPTDLSRTFLRSVSPIHIQYLKNMNVSATMTISLIREGKLWGLVACHHSVPRLISTDVRSCCKFIGKLVSSQLRTKEELEDLDYKAHLLRIYKDLVENMKREKSITAGLFKHTPNLVDLIGSGGAAAAIQIEGEWTLIGKTPSVEQIDRLAEWLIEAGHDKDLFTTRNLSSVFPEAEAYKNVASGLAAITIPKTRKSFIFWFRPEVIETVTWAGNPNKNIEILPDGTLKIDPRASFDGWKETVRNQSNPWRKPEIEAITSLRHSIIELDLQQQFDQEQKGRRELETEKSKMDLVMNNLPVFMWAMSNDGDFTYLAGRELTHLGFDTKSLVGQNYRTIFGDSPEISRAVNLALKGEVALADMRLQNKTYRTYFSPFFDRGGLISGITAISRNVSEVAETEAALRASENRYELLVDSIRDYAIFTINTEGLITSWNKGAEKVLGYSEKEVLGKSAELIFSKVDGHQRLQEKEMQIALRTGEARDDGWHTQKSGKQFWGSGTLTPIFNSNKELTGYVKILRDLTDKKLAEDQMREALRLRDEFLSVASHELKTPLTSLKLQTQLYKRHNDKNNATYDRSQVDKMVDLTERQVQRLNRLVDDMLDISRIRSGKLSIKRETFDLCELIKETMERLKPMFISAGCGEPTLVTCDEVKGSWDKMRIDQVLTNLLTNAIRYGRGWPVEIRVTRNESKVTIAVQDQGMGIDKKNHERIFESYERASNDVSGLGLGLFITKQIIAAHGGRIWVESELNRGAIFFVELPLGTELTRGGEGRE